MNKRQFKKAGNKILDGKLLCFKENLEHSKRLKRLTLKDIAETIIIKRPYTTY